RPAHGSRARPPEGGWRRKSWPRQSQERRITMNSPLKRDIAPLTTQAWKLIDDEAQELLRTYLSARRFVDVSGPHGWEHAAVNTGRLEVAEAPVDKTITWGQREVLPLVEVRVPFTLLQMELDS